MAKKNDIEDSSASLNGETDLEGKMIIDSRGEKIGVCKAVKIGDDGQISLSFEVEINDKQIIPSQTIPYSAIGKITDVIELKVPINIKVAQSAEELKSDKITEEAEEEEDQEEEVKEIEEEEEEKEEKEEPKEIIISEEMKEGEVKEIKEEERKIEEAESEKEEDHSALEKVSEKVNQELIVPAEKLTGKIEAQQADATAQLSKTLPDDAEVDKITQPILSIEELKKLDVSELIVGLEESAKRIDVLFKHLASGEANTKIEAIKALTDLTKISPELGLSLLQQMMKLNDEPQQDVRLAVAQQMERISDTKPELFKGYFLELFENAFEEPIEEIREQLLKNLHNIAMKIPEVASKGLEEFLEEVIIGKRVPEVPNKLLHDATLKVISGNFLLTRISIKVRLKFVAKGGNLGIRCAEELEDYNATLIGLTIIESFTPEEAEKLIQSSSFKKIGSIFVDVINQMIEAYKEGSFKQLSDVVDKKIEIPTAVIERFYEIKLTKTLEGAQNIPLEVFLENAMVDPEEAEQIIYRLVMQKRINAAITMNNGKTFITALEINGVTEKKTTEKPKTTKKTTTTPKKKTTTTKTAATKKPSTATKTGTAKKSTNSTTKKTTTKPKTTTKKTTTAKKTTSTKKTEG